MRGHRKQRLTRVARLAFAGSLLLAIATGTVIGGTVFFDGFDDSGAISVTPESRQAAMTATDRPVAGVDRTVAIELFSGLLDSFPREPGASAAFVPGQLPDISGGLRFSLRNGLLELDVLRASLTYSFDPAGGVNLTGTSWIQVATTGFGGPVGGSVTFGEAFPKQLIVPLVAHPSTGTPFDTLWTLDPSSAVNVSDVGQIRVDFLINPGSDAGLDVFGVSFGSGSPPGGGAVPLPAAAFGGMLLLGIIGVFKLRRRP